MATAAATGQTWPIGYRVPVIYLLHLSLAITAFLVVLNGFLRGSRKTQIDALLSVILVGLLVTVFWVFGWKVGALAVALAFIYAGLSRPLAARAAARVFSIGDPNTGNYPGLPPAQLERISRELGRPFDAQRILEEMIHDPDRSARADADLAVYCMSHAPLQDIIREFHLTPEAITELYRQLAVAGAGQWAGGHYVAASALSYPNTLRFLLESKGAGVDQLEIAYSLVMYFERGHDLPAPSAQTKDSSRDP